MASSTLTPVQQVRVLLSESLKCRTMDATLDGVMQQKIRSANERMQDLILSGRFPHPSMIDFTDHSAALQRSNEQHVLALLRHLADVLNHPIRGSDSEGKFGAREKKSGWCDILMCLSVVLIPLCCYKLNQELEQTKIEREFNKQTLLAQYRLMLSIFEKESTAA